MSYVTLLYVIYLRENDLKFAVQHLEHLKFHFPYTPSALTKIPLSSTARTVPLYRRDKSVNTSCLYIHHSYHSINPFINNNMHQKCCLSVFLHSGSHLSLHSYLAGVHNILFSQLHKYYRKEGVIVQKKSIVHL